MSICIVLMPYRPDNVCFKLLGLLENSWNSIFSHSCTNPATSFHISQWRGGSRILETGVQSVLIPAIFWGFTFPQSQIPPEKHPKHTHNKNASNLPLRYVLPLRAPSLELTLGPISEDRTWIEGAKRAKIDGKAQEKAGEPLARKFSRI